MSNSHGEKSLNKTLTSSESVMIQMLLGLIIPFILVTFIELYTLKYFNFIVGNYYFNFITAITDPINFVSWYSEQLGGAMYYYILYYTALTIPPIAAIAGAYFMIKISWITSGAELITKGSTVITNTKSGLAKATKLLKSADGLHIHPKIKINKQQEVAHTLIAGATRSGKSQTIMHMLISIFKRKDRAVVFDVKGDFVSLFYKLKGVAIINPADRRSLYWDISKDILNSSSARMLALSFMPSNPKDSQPMFASNARKIFAGLIIYLCVTKTKKWGWVELAEVVNKTPAQHKKLLESVSHKECLAAANIIVLDQKTGEPSKTVMSYYASLDPATSSLNQIAAWWGDRPAIGGFSLVKYVNNPRQAEHFIILSAQADKMETEYGALYAAFYSILINLSTASKIPQNDDRRLFLVIDELAFFPKIEGLNKIVQLGGGFGLSFIGGIQDIGMIQHKYGKDLAMSFISNINTFICGKLNDEETASWAAGLFGKQRTERQTISQNAQGNSTAFSTSDRDALLNSDFLDLPKASLKYGYEMFLRTDADSGPVRVKLHYPVVARKQRAASFIPVCDDDEFSIPDLKLKTTTSSSDGNEHTIQEENINKNTHKIVKQQTEEVEQKTVTTITIDPKKSKEAAAIIGGNEAIDFVEEPIIEAAAEATGTPSGAVNALITAMDLMDLAADAVAVKDTVNASTITTEEPYSGAKKKLRFKKKDHEIEVD